MKKSLALIALALVAAGAAVLAPRRDAAASDRCQRVRATIADALVTSGCPSPVGLCTAGTIDGSILEGSVYTVVNAIAPAATTGDLSFDTSMKITAEGGTITFHGAAVFDPVHGAISIIATDPVGTGKLAGATGRLFVHASTTPTNAVGEIDGEICLAP
jgi:hypothetical protein